MQVVQSHIPTYKSDIITYTYVYLHSIANRSSSIIKLFILYTFDNAS